MTIYHIKREWEEYKLLIPKKTENPREDVGHWTPILNDEHFSNFYYLLFEEYFLDVDENDTILYDTSISPMEREHINLVFNLCKRINSERYALVHAFEEYEESLRSLLEESEEGMGMPVDLTMGLNEKIESAIEELSFD